MIPYCFCPKCGDAWGFTCEDGKWKFHICNCFKDSEDIDESKVREVFCIPESWYGFKTKKGLAKSIVRIARSLLYVDEDCCAGDLIRSSQRIYNFALAFSGYGTKTMKSLMTEESIRELKEKEEIENQNNYSYVDYIDESNYKDYIGKKVNVRKYVDLSYLNLESIPIIFGKVNGDFYCNNCGLKYLKNCPYYVGGSFYCNDNNISSLEGCPSEIEKDFYCHRNCLESLNYCPRFVGRDFYCYKNKIESLHGCTTYIGRDFNMDIDSILLSPEGCPKFVGRYFSLTNCGKVTKDDVTKICNIGGRIWLLPERK